LDLGVVDRRLPAVEHFDLGCIDVQGDDGMVLSKQDGVGEAHVAVSGDSDLHACSIPVRTNESGSARRRSCLPRRWLLGFAACVAKSVSVLTDETLEYGHEYDAQVQPERPVLEVVQVVPDALRHLLDGIRLAAESIYLRPAGD